MSSEMRWYIGKLVLEESSSDETTYSVGEYYLYKMKIQWDKGKMSRKELMDFPLMFFHHISMKNKMSEKTKNYKVKKSLSYNFPGENM